jgi:hypothetical protein
MAVEGASLQSAATWPYALQHEPSTITDDVRFGRDKEWFATPSRTSISPVGKLPPQAASAASRPLRPGVISFGQCSNTQTLQAPSTVGPKVGVAVGVAVVVVVDVVDVVVVVVQGLHGQLVTPSFVVVTLPTIVKSFPWEP